jgi:signal transduction histidine kinase
VLGKNSLLLQGLTYDSGEMEKIKESLIRKESAEFELLNRKKNGDQFWNNFTIVPVADKSGAYTHWVSIQRDVTARRQHEEITRKKLEKLIEERTLELHQALTKEKELVEMKSRFVAIASHEFRTPLSTINFATNFLQDHFHQLSQEEISSKLKRIEKQVTHMTSLLEDVILVGRNELNKIQVMKSSVQIRNFIDKIMEEVVQTTKNTHAINLIYEVKTDYLVADEKLLRNIFINLLTNAIKFSPDRKEIQVILSQQGQYLMLNVLDQGIGISESDQKHLYEAFYRGENTSAIAGSGLGLSIVKKAVELLNGEMELQSEVNKGTQVKIKLPLA